MEGDEKNCLPEKYRSGQHFLSPGNDPYFSVHTALCQPTRPRQLLCARKRKCGHATNVLRCVYHQPASINNILLTLRWREHSSVHSKRDEATLLRLKIWSHAKGRISYSEVGLLVAEILSVYSGQERKH